MTVNLTREECIDFVIEFLQVSFHQILWSRKIYPSEIFDETQKFNIVVHKSAHPEVNAYIDSTLSTVKFLLSEDSLAKLALVIQNGTRPLERFTFALESFFKTTPSGKVLLNRAEVQQQARALWMTIGQRFGSGEGGRSEGDNQHQTFTFEIHTRSWAYEKILCKQSTEQEFQWIEADKIVDPESVTPIRRLDSQPFRIDVYVENYEGD